MHLIKSLCSLLNINWADIDNNDLFSVDDLVNWLELSKNEACARHPWPFTEGERDIATVGSQEEYDYPTAMKSDSLRYLTVNDERYEKLTFEDYLTYKEDYETGTRKFFSDRNRTLYINYLAEDFSNSIVCYGQVYVTDAIDSTSTSTVFSAGEPEGDTAILHLAYAEALGSDKMKNPDKAMKEKLEAFETLDSIWQRIADKQSTYQTKDRPLFKRIDVIEGGIRDELNNPNQF